MLKLIVHLHTFLLQKVCTYTLSQGKSTQKNRINQKKTKKNKKKFARIKNSSIFAVQGLNFIIYICTRYLIINKGVVPILF
jgi:hypothetical protein